MRFTVLLFSVLAVVCAAQDNVQSITSPRAGVTFSPIGPDVGRGPVDYEIYRYTGDGAVYQIRHTLPGGGVYRTSRKNTSGPTCDTSTTLAGSATATGLTSNGSALALLSAINPASFGGTTCTPPPGNV